MCRKLICLVSFVLVLFLAGAAQAVPLQPNDGSISGNLSLWLRAPGTYFNPSTGVWTDVSPKGNDAEPVGYVDAWGITYVAPTLSSGSNPLVFDSDFSTVKFGADTDDLMRATNLNGGVGPGELTILAVYKATPPSPSIVRALGFGSISGEGENMGNNFNLSVDVSIRKDNGMVGGATVAHPDDQFLIRVARMNSIDIDQWFNSDGTLVQVHAAPGTAFITSVDNFYLGDLRAGSSTTIGGSLAISDIEIAEVVVYNTALSEAQIEGVSEWLQANVGVVPVIKVASKPSPADGATGVPRDGTVLSWAPGEFAAMHDVHFGPSFDDVNDATDASAVYLGRQGETTYALDRLERGQTYYWRIDEVNDLNPDSPWKGDVWQFMVEPVAYPMPSERITATASSSNSPDEGPENTINGSGLDADDLHSVGVTDMWLSGAVDPNAAWIQYEFDRVYKLHEMLVWNHNTSLELTLGFGVKDAAIEHSVDGVNWIALGDFEFARGSAVAGYAHNTTVGLNGVAAKYVKITANSNWGGIFPQYGLSEVRFFYVPVLASQPIPLSGTADMDMDNVTLTWRAGREAALHEVHLSTDQQAVIDGTAAVATVSETSYDTGELELGQIYYWKVAEINEAETPTIWEGDLWNFSTQEYLVVDGFEDYNDSEPERIFDTWIDGWGVPTNGSTIGYPNPVFVLDEHFVETTIVHSGGQSTPFFYDNTAGATYSEATRSIDALRDWTRYGIKSLTLWFYGDPNNPAEQMYVKLDGVKVTYDGDVSDIKEPSWQQWNIELADFGVNLTNVTELSIGFERSGLAGGKGMVYFDDVRLSSYDRQLVTPAGPSRSVLRSSTSGLRSRFGGVGTTKDEFDMNVNVVNE